MNDKTINMKAEELKEQFLSDWCVFTTYEGSKDFREDFREDLDRLLNQRVIEELENILNLHYPTPDAVVVAAQDIEKRIKELKQ